MEVLAIADDVTGSDRDHSIALRLHPALALRHALDLHGRSYSGTSMAEGSGVDAQLASSLLGGARLPVPAGARPVEDELADDGVVEPVVAEQLLARIAGQVERLEAGWFERGAVRTVAELVASQLGEAALADAREEGRSLPVEDLAAGL